MQNDSRNVVDQFKGVPTDIIKAQLDNSRVNLEIAIENLERDFDMGTIVRSANAFNVREIHIIGSKQWNKRGAMKTDAYMNITYHPDIDAFWNEMKERQKEIIAVDIVKSARPLSEQPLPSNAVLVFGAEKSGLSQRMLSIAKSIVMIEQFGSTRSINVGVAAGIAMYVWVQQHVLNTR